MRHDPTGTYPQVRRFVAESQRRVARLKRLTREFLIDHDFLGLRAVTVSSVAQGSGIGPKLDSFARWFKSAAETVLSEHRAEWISPFVLACYDKGRMDASRRTRTQYAPDDSPQSGLMSKYAHEVDGIADVTEQQVVRVVYDGLTTRQTAQKILLAAQDRIDRIAGARLKALAHFACVDAYNAAALDLFESVGVTRVGVLPESRARRRVRAGDAKYREGSKTIVPSRRTVQRIRARQRALEETVGSEVDVETAGDELVCQECEDIADSGPYEINEARGLIPAHPRCRCAFVPHVEESEE